MVHPRLHSNSNNKHLHNRSPHRKNPQSKDQTTLLQSKSPNRKTRTTKRIRLNPKIKTPPLQPKRKNQRKTAQIPRKSTNPVPMPPRNRANPKKTRPTQRTAPKTRPNDHPHRLQPKSHQKLQKTYNTNRK